MGRRRVLTALLALVLALSGTVLLTRYVRGADSRAMAGTAVTKVLVVTRLVPQGTPVEKLSGFVATKSLPAVAVAPGALSGLAEAGGRVTAVDLQPGEQLLATRLVDPASLQKSDKVTVPAGLQQVTVGLEPQRIVGGDLAPGDLVGVMVTFAKEDTTPAATTLALQKVLVTRVGNSTSPTGSDTSSANDKGSTTVSSTNSSSTAKVLVTFAVDTAAAQTLVFSAEQGSLWLTHQDANTPTTAPPALTRKDVDR